MTVILHYMRYHTHGSMRCEDVKDAVGSAWAMVEDNTAWPSHVTDEEGMVLLDNEALGKRIYALDQWFDKQERNT